MTRQIVHYRDLNHWKQDVVTDGTFVHNGIIRADLVTERDGILPVRQTIVWVVATAIVRDDVLMYRREIGRHISGPTSDEHATLNFTLAHAEIELIKNWVLSPAFNGCGVMRFRHGVIDGETYELAEMDAGHLSSQHLNDAHTEAMHAAQVTGSNLCTGADKDLAPDTPNDSEEVETTT